MNSLKKKFYADYNKIYIHEMDSRVLWGAIWGLKLAKKAVKSSAQPWAAAYVEALIEEIESK